MENRLAPHLDEIKRALDNEIDDKRILLDLKKLLEFRVPLEEAKRSLIKKYGGDDRSIERKLDDIMIGDRNIQVTVKVLEMKKRTISTRNGEKTIYSGILSDETAARSFTAWHDFGLKIGDVFRITQVYVRNWQDRPEINFGNRSKVTKLDTTIEIKQESRKKLSELRDGDLNVNTAFTILSIELREIITKDGNKTILNGICADDKTKSPFTSWVSLPELTAGKSIEVVNAYVRSFRGIPTLHINENTRIKELENRIEFEEPQKVLIRDIIEKEGAIDVVVEGNVLSVRPGSGLVARCPECSRVIQKSICRVHGKVAEIMDLRIKAIIDDGTGALTLVLNAEMTQKLCNITIEQAKDIAKTAMSQNAAEDEIKKKLLGKILTAKGNMSRGEFGITLVATDVREAPDTIKERASKLLSGDGING
jgi:replication factor A1